MTAIVTRELLALAGLHANFLKPRAALFTGKLPVPAVFQTFLKIFRFSTPALTGAPEKIAAPERMPKIVMPDAAVTVRFRTVLAVGTRTTDGRRVES